MALPNLTSLIMLFKEFFRLLKLECTCSSSYFQISQNRNQTQAKILTVMMTLFQRNLDVPMTPLNQPACKCIASRFQCYLLMYFKMNDKKKTSCFLICLCCISLQISFFFILSVYIYQVL